MGSVSSYFQAFYAEDTERVDELCERYSLINERLSKYGIDMFKAGNLDNVLECTYHPDLEIQLWDNYEVIFYMGRWHHVDIDLEDMPEHVAKYIETKPPEAEE